MNSLSSLRGEPAVRAATCCHGQRWLRAVVGTLAAALLLGPAAALATVDITDVAVPASVTTGTGATNVLLDGFAIRSTANNPVTVASVTLTFTSTSSTAQDWLQDVRITQGSDGTGTVYSTGFTVAGNTVTVATTAFQAPKSTLAALSAYVLVDVLPAPTGSAGGTTTLSAVVSSLTSATVPSSDTTKASVTVDNAAPANVTGVTATPSTGQISLGWTNPGADFAQVVVARRTGAAVTSAPNEGALPAVNDTWADGSVVVYVGPVPPFPDAVSPGSYYYKIFAGDSWENWAAGASAGPSSPSTPSNSTVLGSGSDPSAAPICPGAAATYVDQLTFTVAGANDTVNGLTVPLLGTTGVGAALSQVELRTSAGASFVPAKTAAIAGDTATFTGAALPANVGATTYTVYVTPRDHAAITGSPTLQARVSGFSGLGGNTTSGSDTASTFTLDGTAPASPGWGATTAGDGQVVLAWTNPGGDFAQTVVVRKQGSAPTGVPADGQLYAVNGAIGDGTVVFLAAATPLTFTDSTVTNGLTYHYGLYARDACGNYSAVATTGPLAPRIAVPGAPGDPTFSAIGQTTVTLTWTNATGATSYRVERAPDTTMLWAQVAPSVAAGAGTTSWTDSGPLAANTKYWYRVRGTNPGGDGPYDATPQAVTTLASPPSAPGAIGISSVGQTTLTVSWGAATGVAPITYRLERAPDAGAGAGTWAEILANATSPQPDSGLTPGAKYWYRARASNAGGYGPYSAPASVTTLPATTAVGDGSNPADPPAAICPGAGATFVDAFTLSSTGAADSIGAVTVKLSPAAAYLNVATIDVTDASDVSKGSATVKGDSTRVGLIGGIPSPVGPAAAYKVRITPKPHLGSTAMPAASNGQSYPTTALVTGIQGQNPSQTFGDAAPLPGFGTVTVDNRSPANPSWGAVTTVPGSPNSTVTLGWTPPADTDLAQLIILRKAGGPVTELPVEGTTTYAVNQSIGLSTIVYLGNAGATSTPPLSIPNGVSHYFRIFARDGCGNWSSGAQVGPIVATAGGTAGVEGDTTFRSQKPTVSIINPSKGAAVTGELKVQVRVFSPGLAPVTGVALNTDGSATFPATPIATFSRNPNFDGSATDRGVWEATLTLAAGSHTLRARATNGSGSTSSAAVPIRVNSAATKGGGTMLRRDNSSQLCKDCHTLKSHSSEAAGSKYGAWATSCGDCHSPHGTTNVFLVDGVITPPAVTGYQAPKPVFFSSRAGYSTAAGATNKPAATFGNADNTGPCQACHTRTSSPSGTTPRFRNTGSEVDGHYTKEPTSVPASSMTCTRCHTHANGFSAIPGGQCQDCHLVTGTETDSYAWDGTKAIIDPSAWTTRGHGASAAYASGNPGANFDLQGALRGDRGCLYCHTSSTSHGDKKNYFRLANTDTALGPNGTCKICHDVKPGNATGYDPDGPTRADGGNDYPLINGTKLVSFNHEGSRHLPVSGNHSGGIYCWDCHDPHGDGTQHFMMQAKLVQRSIPAGVVTLPAPPYADLWGTPDPTNPASSYDFTKVTAGTLTTSDPLKYDYEDYYLNGFCRACHDAPTTTPAPCSPSTPCGVRYFNKAAATCGTANSGCVGAGNGAQYHPTSLSAGSRRRCTDCHVHKLSCGGCHVAPPTSGLHATHNQRAMADQDVDYTAPDTEATTTLYGYRCVKCHNEDHMTLLDDPSKGKSFASPYPIGIVFPDVADVTRLPAYASGSPPASGSPYQSSSPTGHWFAWTIGTCSNVYCHSNGAPADVPVVFKNVTWAAGGGLGGSWGCTSCHGDNVSATATMSKAHALHFASGYAYGCAKCHLSVSSSNTQLNTVDAPGGKFLHGNGLKDVKFDAFQGQGGGTYDGIGKTCSNTYCHSNGASRGATSYSNGPSIAWTTTGQTTCGSCHGDASTIGAAKGGTAAHVNHVNKSSLIGVNIGCRACHSATVDSNTNVSSRANHVDGLPGVSLAAITSPTLKTRSGGTPGGTSPGTTCNTNWCHSTGQETLTPTPVTWTATWAANAVCKGCHGTGSLYAGEPSYANATGTPNSHGSKHVPGASSALAFASCVRCHATTVTTAGTAILTTTPSKHLDGDRDVAFANVGTNPGGGVTPYNASRQCQSYCHSNGGPLGGATTYASPVWGGSPIGAQMTCTSCHGGKDVATATMSLSHAKHVNSTAGNYAYGCWQCHWIVTQADGVILASSTKHVDGVKTDVSFDTTWPSWAPQASAAYNASHQCSNTYCHGAFPGGNGNVTVTWNSTITCTSCHGNPPADTSHGTVVQGADCGGCHTGYTATTVNAGEHVNGAKSGGGGCLGCHGGVKGSRRNVVPDFALNSHHVGRGGAGSFMGTASALTDNDCLVCHAEGSAASQGAKPSVDDYNASSNPSGRHMNGVIDLRNADNNTNYFEYDSTAIMALGAAGANSSNLAFKKEMSGRSDDAVGTPNVACVKPVASGYTCSKGLDRFCVSCHDADGARAASSQGDVGATRMNPFRDVTGATPVISNEYDQQNRSAVVDVGSRVAETGTTCSPRTDTCTSGTYASLDRDPGVRGGTFARPDPPEGVFARHAVRGLSLSVYVGTSAWDTTTYWNRAKVSWQSSSLMACADCHSSDGANKTVGNAHGASSEYLLKDASGGASEASPADYASYSCAACHLYTWYRNTRAGGSHAPNDTDFVDYSNLTGAARIPVGNTGGNVFGNACANCHGGGSASKAGSVFPSGSAGLGGYGTIHGTSQIIGTGANGGVGSRNAYRIMNGNSMRYYDPADWTTTASRTCYTIQSLDSWGGCTKHGSGTSRAPMAPAVRPLAY